MQKPKALPLRTIVICVIVILVCLTALILVLVRKRTILPIPTTVPPTTSTTTVPPTTSTTTVPPITTTVSPTTTTTTIPATTTTTVPPTTTTTVPPTTTTVPPTTTTTIPPTTTTTVPPTTTTTVPPTTTTTVPPTTTTAPPFGPVSQVTLRGFSSQYAARIISVQFMNGTTDVTSSCTLHEVDGLTLLDGTPMTKWINTANNPAVSVPGKFNAVVGIFNTPQTITSIVYNTDPRFACNSWGVNWTAFNSDYSNQIVSTNIEPPVCYGEGNPKSQYPSYTGYNFTWNLLANSWSYNQSS
jgi:hypothetical protein